MKTFTRDFFNESNFIIRKKEYNFLPEHQSDEIWHICYNVNDNYIPIMGTSVISIIENNPQKNFVIHIFSNDCTQDNAEKVEKLAENEKCCCIIYYLDMNQFSDFHIKVKRFSYITYGRLYFPKILKNITKRYLYIDADAICVGDLNELFHYDLHGAAMGAVSEFPKDARYRSDFLKLKNHKYFNDGIMGVDIDQWEKEQITEKCFSYQCEPPERFLGQSQDILNLVFDGTNYFIPYIYNVDSYDEAMGNTAKIVHWRGRRKPWQMVLSKYDEQWRAYNKNAPWETITNILPIKKPENYHDFKFWGQYQKKQKNWGGYLQGLFLYAYLRLRFKLRL